MISRLLMHLQLHLRDAELAWSLSLFNQCFNHKYFVFGRVSFSSIFLNLIILLQYFIGHLLQYRRIK